MPSFARGFIGLAFRVSASKDKFEGIYVRPTNGRADDQIRRNHSIQYFHFQDMILIAKKGIPGEI